jgi:hypothetical protein
MSRAHKHRSDVRAQRFQERMRARSEGSRVEDNTHPRLSDHHKVGTFLQDTTLPALEPVSSWTSKVRVKSEYRLDSSRTVHHCTDDRRSARPLLSDLHKVDTDGQDTPLGHRSSQPSTTARVRVKSESPEDPPRAVRHCAEDRRTTNRRVSVHHKVSTVDQNTTFHSPSPRSPQTSTTVRAQQSIPRRVVPTHSSDKDVCPLDLHPSFLESLGPPPAQNDQPHPLQLKFQEQGKLFLEQMNQQNQQFLVQQVPTTHSLTVPPAVDLETVTFLMKQGDAMQKAMQQAMLRILEGFTLQPPSVPPATRVLPPPVVPPLSMSSSSAQQLLPEVAAQRSVDQPPASNAMDGSGI